MSGTPHGLALYRSLERPKANPLWAVCESPSLAPFLEEADLEAMLLPPTDIVAPILALEETLGMQAVIKTNFGKRRLDSLESRIIKGLQTTGRSACILDPEEISLEVSLEDAPDADHPDQVALQIWPGPVLLMEQLKARRLARESVKPKVVPNEIAPKGIWLPEGAPVRLAVANSEEDIGYLKLIEVSAKHHPLDKLRFSPVKTART
jgi:hypothetical protein